MESKASFKHLRDETYYHELYDRFTIEDCQRREDLKDGETTKEKYKDNPAKGLVVDLGLYFIKGERYRKKSETISQWIARDSARDQKLANAIEPRGIRCLTCSSLMNSTMRDLRTDIDEKKDRVLFFYECPKSHKGRAFWENGEEWKYIPPLCPKCQTIFTHINARKGNTITTTYTCPKCSHTETSDLDLDEKEKEETIDPNFEADRQKYCLSDKEGGEYISWTANLERLTEMMKDHEENKEVFDAMAKIKKLTLVEIQNLLNPVIEVAGYTKLEFGRPEIQRDLHVEFSVQDNMPGRTEYDSLHKLRKLINKTVEETNWRLTSDSVSYKLGFLTGRLRGVEGEENLRKLVEKLEKKNKNQ